MNAMRGNFGPVGKIISQAGVLTDAFGSRWPHQKPVSMTAGGWELSHWKHDDNGFGDGFVVPAGFVALWFCIHGSGEISPASHSNFCFHAGQAALFNSNDRVVLDSVDASGWRLTIPEALLHDRLVQQGQLASTGKPRARFQLCERADVDLISELVRKCSASDQPDIKWYCQSLILISMTSTWVFEALLQTSTSDIKDKRLKQCRDYLIPRLKSDIDISDMACHVGLTTRSLYRLFRNHINRTPGEYVRLLRLEAAYSELSDPDCRMDVTRIAMEYGFTNMGRFAKQYKDCFGELPSITYRRSVSGSSV